MYVGGMMEYIHTLLRNPEYLHRMLYVMVSVLFGFGLFFLFYAYIAEASRDSSVSVFSGLGMQVAAFAIGLFFLHIFSKIRYQVYRKFIFGITGCTALIMLSLITPLAIERNGAVRWIDLGVLQFQPSEIMKITFIMFFAFLFTHPTVRQHVGHFIGYTVAACAVLAVASFMQPDFGTAFLIAFSVLGMALIARLPLKWWVPIVVIGMFGAVTVSVVPSYISTRVSTFYDIHFGELTSEQRYGVAYQPLQTLKAVQVGGAVGQGPGFVAQTSQLDIPEITTDSIFALVAAETGFIGSLFIIILFSFFFFLCYTAARYARDAFGAYLVVGITTLFASQFFINILVVLALPATGIPLIFFSRGGTSLVITMAAVGIILNVLRQQQGRRSLYRGSLV